MQVFTPRPRKTIVESDLDQRLVRHDHSLVADQDDSSPSQDDEEGQQLEESLKGVEGTRHE